MAIVPWLGPSYYTNQSSTVAGGTPWVGIGGDGPSAVFPISLKDYPFCDAIFQNFTAQQYVTTGTAGAAGTYSEKAPDEPVSVHDQKAAGVAAEDTVTMADQRDGTPAPEVPETDDERKARLRAELHKLAIKKNPTAKDKARMTVVEAAIKNGHKE